MTTKEIILDQCKNAEKYILEQLRKQTRIPLILASLEELEETAYLNLFGGFISISVHNREDLAKCLKLIEPGKIWSKGSRPQGIEYATTIHDVHVFIVALDDALPSTCTVVEELVTIPAQPERTEMRKVVKCNQPKEENKNEPNTNPTGLGEQPFSGQLDVRENNDMSTVSPVLLQSEEGSREQSS